MPKELVLDGNETLQGLNKANQVLFKVTQILFHFVPGMWIFNFITLDRKNANYICFCNIAQRDSFTNDIKENGYRSTWEAHSVK